MAAAGLSFRFAIRGSKTAATDTLFGLTARLKGRWVHPMSNYYYSVIARARLIMRSLGVGGLFERIPFACRIAHGLGVRARSILIPGKARVWVKVESGLAKGLWLHLSLVGEEKYWLGYHELPVQDVLQKLAVSGRTVYDIGAQIGFFSLAVARLVGRSGQVLAFEPEPESAERLKEHAS